MMTHNDREALVTSVIEDGIARVSLNRPVRHNSLIPDLLDALNDHLAKAAEAEPKALILAGAGPTFSSGGDVGGFAAHHGDGLIAYAHHVVSGLNDALMKVLTFPAPVLTRLQGFVTGGSCGFVFAADYVVMAEDAFIAPYYCEVGFSPDGGWTALLPELIGAAQAARLQMLNVHIKAEHALQLGIVSHVVGADHLDTEIDAIVAKLSQKAPQTLRSTKRLLRNDAEVERLRAALDAECNAFIDLIGLDDTRTRMEAFLSRG